MKESISSKSIKPVAGGIDDVVFIGPIEVRVANDIDRYINRIVSRGIFLIPFAIELRVVPVNRLIDVSVGNTHEHSREKDHESLEGKPQARRRGGMRE